MRISELDHRIRRLREAVAMERAASIDPLSQGLWDYGAELAKLDALGLVIEAEALGAPVEAIQSMRASYIRPF